MGLFLKIFDQPLIIWNINILDKIKKIDTILIPEKYSETYSKIKEQFPSIKVNFITGQEPNLSNISQTGPKSVDISELEQIELSLNSVVYQSKETHKIIIETIKYPWDYLRIIQDVLQKHVLESKISPNAKIAESTVLEGPCIIEDNVVIDDFCKIKGPIFIGKDSFIGMGSLVRNCILGGENLNWFQL